MVNKKAPNGSVTIEIADDGTVNIRCDVSDNESVDPIYTQLKAAVTGLSYLYEKDMQQIDKIGQAFLDGVERGLSVAGAEEDESKVGFRAKI